MLDNNVSKRKAEVSGMAFLGVFVYNLKVIIVQEAYALAIFEIAALLHATVWMWAEALYRRWGLTTVEWA